MEKILFIIIVVLCVLTSCNNESNDNENLENETLESETVEKEEIPYVIGNPIPEDVYNTFENADFFVVDNNVVCLRESGDGWVQNLDFTDAEKIGIIERSGIDKDWEKWDSTLLETGTEIFVHSKRSEAYMAITKDGEKLYYIAMLEG